MKPTSIKERMQLSEDAVFEDETTDTGMSDEDLKIESLKIATNIGKLMSNVTTEDIVSIAETVAKFIKGGKDAALETTTDNTEIEETPENNEADTEEEFSTDEETPENNEAENESSEDFEV